MTPDLDPLYVLEELEHGGDIDCPHCLSNINIFGPNTPTSNEPFSFSCPHCKQQILELTKDGAAAYERLKEPSMEQEKEKLDWIMSNMDNVMSDKKIESIKDELVEVKDKIR